MEEEAAVVRCYTKIGIPQIRVYNIAALQLWKSLYLVKLQELSLKVTLLQR